MNRLTMTRAIPDSAPQVPAVLTRWRSAIDSAMRRAVPPPDNAIGRMASYHMGWTDAGGHETNAGPGNGKLFRGHLVIWASDALDGDPRRALPVAAAVEWLHAFTLIHDDVFPDAATSAP